MCVCVCVCVCASVDLTGHFGNHFLLFQWRLRAGNFPLIKRSVKAAHPTAPPPQISLGRPQKSVIKISRILFSFHLEIKNDASIRISRRSIPPHSQFKHHQSTAEIIGNSDQSENTIQKCRPQIKSGPKFNTNRTPENNINNNSSNNNSNNNRNKRMNNALLVMMMLLL